MKIFSDENFFINFILINSELILYERLDKKLLNDYISSIKVWPDYSPDGGKSILQHKDILFPINLEAWRIKAFLRESSTYSFSYVPPGAETGFHSDSNRNHRSWCVGTYADRDEDM